MAYQGQQGGDIRATLALSMSEATTGSSRLLTLADSRQVTVPIPPGTVDGQEIRLEGQGDFSPYSGTRGALILTVSVTPETRYGSPSEQMGTNFPTVFMQAPPPPANALPNQPVSYQPPVYTNYPPQGQNALYSNPTEAISARPGQYMPPGQYTPPPPVQPAPRRRGLSPVVIVLLVVLVALIIGGSGLIYYSAVYQPNQLHLHATATAGAQQTGTAQVNATSTAQAVATSTAIANATATAVAQATAQAQATVTAQQNFYNSSTGGTPTINDSLTGPTPSNWAEGQGCAFTGGAYHATISDNNFFRYCPARAYTFSNFAFQVQMTIVKGEYGGMIFRADEATGKLYLLEIRQDGTYALYFYPDSSGNTSKRLRADSLSNFQTGLNKTNLITIIATSSTIYLYVNKTFVTSVNDNQLTSGEIGLVGADLGVPVDVAFNNAQVWQL